MVEATLTHAELKGGLITAGSFDTGFAPLWKWAIVESARRPDNAGARGHIDFSRFDGATIVFKDPNTWRRPTAEFPYTREQVDAGSSIVKMESAFPAWTVESVALPAAPLPPAPGPDPSAPQ